MNFLQNNKIQIVNSFKIIGSFTIMFLILTLLLKPFQLIGLTDYGFWLSSFYNYLHFGNYETSVGERYNYMQFPLLLIFSPLAYIKDNIVFTYLLNYLTFLSWFFVFYYFLFKTFDIRKMLLAFLLFFGSTTILFHYNLNYNGWESEFLAVPFLTISYYLAFIKKQYTKSILLYLPLFLIKIQFWLMIFFFLIAIAIYDKNKKYIYYSVLSIIFFFLYLKLQTFIFPGEASSIMLSDRYGYLFDFSSFSKLFKIMLTNITVKVALISAFFIQFLFLIDLKKISKIDFYVYFLLIFTTFSYSILSTRLPMSYWTHEHYVLSVLPVIFLILFKYGSFTKFRIFGYLIVNIILFVGIVSLKQPWQFKTYQDEKQLLSEVRPLLELNYSDHIIAEDRTGIYFTQYQVNYMQYINDKNREPKYIVFNLRYSYLADNVKSLKLSEVLSSFDDLNTRMEGLPNYGIIYLKYPFVVYQKDIRSDKNYNQKMIDEWDEKSIHSNKWF